MTDYTLKRIPAFGFEDSSVYALEGRDQRARDKIANRASWRRVAENAINERHFLSLNRESGIKETNKFKKMGYVPLLGIITGIARLGTFIADGGKTKSPLFVIRGIIETLSLGILLFPIDKAVTAFRNRQWKKLNS